MYVLYIDFQPAPLSPPPLYTIAMCIYVFVEQLNTPAQSEQPPIGSPQ